jgi:DNA primase
MISPAILKQDTDRVRDATDIIAVIGEYVRLKRSGSGRYIGLCPFHKEKTPSFTVTVARRRFKCFGCAAGGDVFSFVQRIEGIDFCEAKEFLASRAGIPLDNRRMTSAERRNYARAATGADALAQRLADFANGLSIVTERHLTMLSDAFLLVGIDPAETLATMHRQADLLRRASAHSIGNLWCAMPAEAAMLEKVGHENRRDAEAITMAVVDMLTTVQCAEPGA